MNLPVKYRPRRFSEVVGQEPVVRTLRNALAMGEERLGRAYLFTGPRGVRKKTIARILAMALNCQRREGPEPCGQCESCRRISAGASIDVIEIDGASNRGINEIRALQENIKFPPAVSKYKIYIIDEVHMLTTEAFNALLKTIEEPPEYLVLMMATTDPQRIPKTVLSRVQRFDLRPLTPGQIVPRVLDIAEREGIGIEREAAELLARYSEGSMRDAIVLLEQLSVYAEGRITPQDVLELLGVVPEEAYRELLSAIESHKPSRVLSLLDELLSRGYFPQDVIRGFMDFLEEQLASAVKGKGSVPAHRLVAYAGMALEAEAGMRYRYNPRFSLEHQLLRMAYLPHITDIGEVVSREEESTMRPPRAEAPRGLLEKLIEVLNLEEIGDDARGNEGRPGGQGQAQ